MKLISKGEHLLQVHLLAYKYHWGYNEILDMTRKDRNLFYEMVLEQLNAENESMKQSSKTSTSSRYAESR